MVVLAQLSALPSGHPVSLLESEHTRNIIRDEAEEIHKNIYNVPRRCHLARGMIVLDKTN